MIADLVRESLAQVPDSARDKNLDEIARLTARDLDELRDEPTAEELAIAMPGVLYHTREALRQLTTAPGYGPVAAIFLGALSGALGVELPQVDEEPDGG